VQGTKSMLRERIVQALHETETPFNVSVENIAIESIKRLVVEGLGIGFVPLMCVREELAHNKLATLWIEGVSNEWNLWLVWRKNHSLSPESRSFVNIIMGKTESFENEGQAALGGDLKKTSPQNQSFVVHPRRSIHC
jgi:DNA-binding transcriptional LysR family regulator